MIEWLTDWLIDRLIHSFIHMTDSLIDRQLSTAWDSNPHSPHYRLGALTNRPPCLSDYRNKIIRVFVSKHCQYHEMMFCISVRFDLIRGRGILWLNPVQTAVGRWLSEGMRPWNLMTSGYGHFEVKIRMYAESCYKVSDLSHTHEQEPCGFITTRPFQSSVSHVIPISNKHDQHVCAFVSVRVRMCMCVFMCTLAHGYWSYVIIIHLRNVTQKSRSRSH